LSKFIVSQILLTGFFKPCKKEFLVSENDVLHFLQINIFLEPFEIVFLVHSNVVGITFGATVFERGMLNSAMK